MGTKRWIRMEIEEAYKLLGCDLSDTEADRDEGITQKYIMKRAALNKNIVFGKTSQAEIYQINTDVDRLDQAYDTVISYKHQEKLKLQKIFANHKDEIVELLNLPERRDSSGNIIQYTQEEIMKTREWRFRFEFEYNRWSIEHSELTDTYTKFCTDKLEELFPSEPGKSSITFPHEEPEVVDGR